MTVNLLDDGGALLSSTVTAGGGLYAFNGLAADDYELEFITPAGFVGTFQNVGADDTVDSDADRVTGRTGVFSLAALTVDDTWDAGYFSNADLGSISNFVWEDLNRNSIQDIGEPGIENATLSLLDPVTLNELASVGSDINGEYIFDNLHGVCWTCGLYCCKA